MRASETKNTLSCSEGYKQRQELRLAVMETARKVEDKGHDGEDPTQENRTSELPSPQPSRGEVEKARARRELHASNG